MGPAFFTFTILNKEANNFVIAFLWKAYGDMAAFCDNAFFFANLKIYYIKKGFDDPFFLHNYMDFIIFMHRNSSLL